MRLIWSDTPDAFDSLAADRVARALKHKPDSVLALPTGQTPVGMYSQLRSRAAAEEVSFSGARIFNLDEYVGLGATHPLSYARYFQTHLLEAVGVPDKNVRLLRGDAADLERECRECDEAIGHLGGLDLAVLGLGANGHIAFNEPGSAWDSTTHVVELSAQTRNVHSHQQRGQHAIPERGITLGIATIRQAREILLLVVGEAKRAALDALREGVPDRQWPVTSLIGHPRLTVISEERLSGE